MARPASVGMPSQAEGTREPQRLVRPEGEGKGKERPRPRPRREKRCDQIKKQKKGKNEK